MLKVVFQVSAMELNSRLDLTEVFCDVDDFYRSFEKYCRSTPQLTAIAGAKRSFPGKNIPPSIDHLVRHHRFSLVSRWYIFSQISPKMSQ